MGASKCSLNSRITPCGAIRSASPWSSTCGSTERQQTTAVLPRKWDSPLQRR